MNKPTIIALIIVLIVIVLAIKHIKNSKGCDCGCKSCNNSCKPKK
ncbi:MULTISPECIES: FeoB-associated Cys-rich membrane protein [Peptoniphilus]|nr:MULTISPECIES: FeoB-associated Cys-rich membrane protein [Peptoniphilus]